MGLFGGGEKKQTAELPAVPRSSPSGPAALSIVGAGMTIQGDVDTGGVVKIEGTVNGHVHASHQVLVAKGGRIDGDVVTSEALIAGAVHGDVVAEQRIEIQSGAVVEGDVTTRRILVAEGAVLNGNVRMGGENGAAAAPARASAPSSGEDSH